MYVDRAIDTELAAWSDEAGGRPLVLRGARQVGKTAAVRRLGERFTCFLELNLERRRDLRLLEGCDTPDDLLLALRVRGNLPRLPERTLLFLDEVQESMKAISWLRFFHEDHPSLAVIAAGSLMEVRLADRGFSFPVGRVTFRYLHPFTFFDFLTATGRAALRDALRDKRIPRAIHEEGLRALRDYLLVGGMPAVVNAWVDSGDPFRTRQVHMDLVQALAEDLHRYRGVRKLEPIEAAFDSLPHHYGSRFKYARFASDQSSIRMRSALEKLEGAMLVDIALPTSSFAPPYRRRPRSAPKLIPLDTGLALAQAGTPFEEVRRADPLSILGGRVAAMLVGQQLRARRLRDREPLWFWVSESSRGNAEIDFLAGGIPVEVKAGPGGALKSMHQFLARGGGRLGIRLNASPPEDSGLRVRVPGYGEIAYRLLSLPIYLAETLADEPWMARREGDSRRLPE